MRKMAVALFALCWAPPAWAADYYVATTGNDTTGTGTVGAPWRTIQNAANIVVAGDTVNIRGGTYSEYIAATTSGTATNPIIYQSFPGESAVIDGAQNPPASMFNLFTIGGSYITLKSLELKRAARQTVIVFGDHVVLDSLTIHDGYRVGVSFYEAFFGTVTNSHVFNVYDFNEGGGNADCINAGGAALDPAAITPSATTLFMVALTMGSTCGRAPTTPSRAI